VVCWRIAPSLCVCIYLVVAAVVRAAQPESGASPEIVLRENWAIQSSADVPDAGATISQPGYDVHSWYRTTVPSTVFSALVKEHAYPDPYVGMNLRTIPGVSYPINTNFSNLPMPPDSPFRHSWWYRTQLNIPADYSGRAIWLAFDGINYRANVWMNGRQIASSKDMAGAWRLFEFDVTAAARPGETNALAVEVFPPQPRDLAITLVDWAPMPPDKEMGIWRDVRITASGPVAVRYPVVLTKLNLPATDQAGLTVRADLKNAAGHTVEGVLKGRIENAQFSMPVQLAPNERRTIRFDPEKYSQLKIANPRLWWPAQVGDQNVYQLELRFETGGVVSDTKRIRFGVREVTSEVDRNGHRVYRINGKNILIRGAGYSFDLLLRSSPERQAAELKYVRDLNLNAIRLEGKLEDDHFLQLCDEWGILVMPGWCCCDAWEKWSQWDDESETIAAESLRDQILRLERHPAVFTWLDGSDFPPPSKIEKMYLRVLEECDWPNPTVSSASNKMTISGPSGVKMSGPYEYVAPSFWYLDTKLGGAHGFNTETSPGPAIPPIETLRRMLPRDHLWPIDTWWDYHVSGMSQTLSIFTEALDNRYGASASVEEYARKAQMQAYEAHRAMMEAYGRNKYTSTGIIQWMLNNAWPSMIWHMYDWYLRPGGSYFGVKSACEPLHVQYSYDDRSIVIVNSYYKPWPNLKLTARVYNLDMTEKFLKDATVGVGPDSSTRVFTLPEVDGLTSTYFLDLRLESSGKLASRNFYWLSTKPETLDWDNSERDPTGEYQISTWTPTKTFADYTALNSLPKVDLEVNAESRRGETESSTAVTIHNPSRALAFGVRLKVKPAPPRYLNREALPEDEILPVIWQDNYFAVLPGETRQVTATYNTRDLGKAAPVVEVEGWNVRAKVVNQ